MLIIFNAVYYFSFLFETLKIFEKNLPYCPSGVFNKYKGVFNNWKYKYSEASLQRTQLN